MEGFNPHNDEYKKVEDLPQEQQAGFVNVDGGFIRKEAKELIDKTEAGIPKLSLFQRMQMLETISGVDLLQLLEVVRQNREKIEIDKVLELAVMSDIVEPELSKFTSWISEWILSERAERRGLPNEYRGGLEDSTKIG